MDMSFDPPAAERLSSSSTRVIYRKWPRTHSSEFHAAWNVRERAFNLNQLPPDWIVVVNRATCNTELVRNVRIDGTHRSYSSS